MKICWIALIFLGFFSFACAQNTDPVEQVADLLEEAEAENSAILENLLKYREHPLPINRATRAELQELLFLTEAQIDSLLAFRQGHPLIRSEKELLAIPGFTREAVEAIRPFIAFETGRRPISIAFRQQWRYNWPEKAGFSSGVYGNPLYLQNRISIEVREHLRMGFLAEKDPGENDWRDFSSFYASYHNKNSRVYLGDFKVLSGMGLLLWTDYGQPLSPGSIRRSICGADLLKAYRSTNEDNPVRGVGFSRIIFEHLEATAWSGERHLDASPEPDGSVRPISATGYHRSENERARKNRLTEKLTGVAVSYLWPNFFMQWVFNQTAYSPTVTDFPKTARHLGLNYAFSGRGIIFRGELALNDRGVPAIQNSITVSLPRIRYQMVGYYYHPDYKLLQGNALGEFSGSPQNRIGAAGLLDFRPLPHLRLQGYIHFYRPAKPQNRDYTTNADYYLQLGMRFHQTKLSLRMKRKYRPIEYALWQSFSRYTHSLQFNLQHPLHQTLLWKQRIEASWSGPIEPAIRYYGISYFSELSWKITENLRVLYRYSGFDIPDYYLRIYEFEPDLPGVLRISAWNNNGERHLLALGYQLKKRVEIHLKYGYLHYFNKETIGSGPDEIHSNHVNEIRGFLLIQW